MDAPKPKGLEEIEKKMGQVEGDSLRHHLLQRAKEFKSSWVDLGKALYTVWKEKRYKGWGFVTFDAYTAKEIGIRKQTALKLLRSYFFLEKEHAPYLRDGYLGTAPAAAVPGYESIDVLRLAKDSGRLDDADLARLTRDVFEKGRDTQEIKRDVASLMRQRQELDPEEAREKKKMEMVRRLLGTLRSLHRDGKVLHLLPAPLLEEIGTVIEKLEAQVGAHTGGNSE
ncbi:MAG: hypothetical protein NTZ78_06990 [Candidatus Aureabacteria bacterium]|nr:hypothetical protein [Candidatus Auribacterota bacterium]